VDDAHAQVWELVHEQRAATVQRLILQTKRIGLATFTKSSFQMNAYARSTLWQSLKEKKTQTFFSAARLIEDLDAPSCLPGEWHAHRPFY
jgi:hypothetical protein